jgi:uncharacterized protein (TIGR02145 family)
MKNIGKTIGYILLFGSNLVMFVFWFSAMSDWLGVWGKVLAIILTPGVVVFPIVYWIVDKVFPMNYFILWGIAWIGLYIIFWSKQHSNRKSLHTAKIGKHKFSQVDQFSEYSSFKDPRDGYIYKTIKIGDQIWLAENLNTELFSNGNPIGYIYDDWEWEKAGSSCKPAWCFYDNTDNYRKEYGNLYNWYAVVHPSGLAPSGWHIPTDKEWVQLIEYLGIDDCISKMKSLYGWEYNRNGTNNSGFSALPAGSRSLKGSFSGLGSHSLWWSTIGNIDWAWVLPLAIDNIKNGKIYIPKSNGCPVRCIKDN